MKKARAYLDAGTVRVAVMCVLMTTVLTGAIRALPSIEDYRSKYRDLDRPLPFLEIVVEIQQELLGQPRMAEASQPPGYTLDTVDVPISSSTVYGYMADGVVRRVRQEEVNLRTGDLSLKDIAIDDTSRRELFISPAAKAAHLMTSPGKAASRDDVLPLYAYFTRVHVSPADLMFDSDDELEFRLHRSLALPEVVDEGMREIDGQSYHSIRVGNYCRYYFDPETRMLQRYEKLTKKGTLVSAVWQLDDYEVIENASLSLPRMLRITEYAGGRAARRITMKVRMARAMRAQLPIGTVPFVVPPGTTEVLK